MIHDTDMVLALRRMGFDSGWAATPDEIILWEREEPQPTKEQILEIIEQIKAERSSEEGV